MYTYHQICSAAFTEGHFTENAQDIRYTVYPKKYAHGFCFAVLCCGNTLTDFPISIRLTSLALWQSNDCPSDSKATLMNMDKYFMWIHYERLHNHNNAKHNNSVCIFLGIYCIVHALWNYPSVSAAEHIWWLVSLAWVEKLENHKWLIKDTHSTEYTGEVFYDSIYIFYQGL